MYDVGLIAGSREEIHSQVFLVANFDIVPYADFPLHKAERIEIELATSGFD
jgi:hypothetical protein